jgi:predicted TIM-barrel fold metal-dependent hydrolase
MRLPEDTWDCHVHVFDPRFPYSEGRDYTPSVADQAALRDAHSAWGVRHAVIVQASVYGTDNRCLLDALSRFAGTARGVAVIDPTSTSDEELADLATAGVRGLRVNLVAGGGTASRNPLQAMADRVRGTGLFLQIYAPSDQIIARQAEIERADMAVVLDHFAGGCDPNTLAPLLRHAPVWIKLSADYRLSPDPEKARTIAARRIAEFYDLIPDRLIWGSDWPHTGGGKDRLSRPVTQIEPFRTVDSLSVPKRMVEAGLSASACRAVLCENPQRLFD